MYYFILIFILFFIFSIIQFFVEIFLKEIKIKNDCFNAIENTRRKRQKIFGRVTTSLVLWYKKNLEGNTLRKFGRKYFLKGNVNETNRIKINDLEASKKIKRNKI